MDREIAFNAYVLADLHSLASQRDYALQRGDRKNYEKLNKLIKAKLEAYNQEIVRIEREEKEKKEDEERRKLIEEQNKKKKGFFARLFDI